MVSRIGGWCAQRKWIVIALWIVLLAGVGVVGILVVLKFVSSLVSKLLLVAIFGGMSWLGFSQRDDLSTCVTRITERARAGDVSDLTCSFFGRDVSVRIPSLPQEG